ncbi:MAG: hypothetical protein ABJC13_10910 [Acidobacteriota bacterium]
MATSFTLVIAFTGLVAFVPVPDSNAPKSVWALLVNAEDGSGSCSPKKSHLHPHFAQMRIPSKNLCTKASCPPGLPEVVSYDLESTDIKLESTGTPPVTVCCTKGSEKKVFEISAGNLTQEASVPASPCEATDFSWVADINKFSTDFAKVCEYCLDEAWSLIKVPADRISARIKLTSGLLQTTRLTRKRSTLDYAIFKAGSGARVYEKTLAEELELTVVLEDKAVFHLCDFLLNPECDHQKTITLYPEKAGEVIRVVLSNDVPRGSPADRLNKHFWFFYKLADAVPTPFDSASECPKSALIPTPENGDFGDPRCPMSQMLPYK